VLVPSPLELKIRGEIRVIFGAKEGEGLGGGRWEERRGERVDRMSEGRTGKSNLSGK